MKIKRTITAVLVGIGALAATVGPAAASVRWGK